MKIAGGKEERGVIVGNTYDKYGSRNFIVRKLMKGFTDALSDLMARAAPRSIHEVGCGEGHWVLHWNGDGIRARGSDFSSQVIAIARDNAVERGMSPGLFEVRSIYDLREPTDSADLVVCCEVLEHLQHPEAGLQALQRIVDRYLIVSAPREPLWRTLNMMRGKYLSDLGNTPGHIQHWTKRNFIEIISKYYRVVETRTPLPWTMVLCRPR